MHATHLSLKWSISRAADTYGYNRVTLTDDSTGKRYACVGGGYDMVGTVLGAWLQDVHADALLTIADRAHQHRSELDRRTNEAPDALYGMTSSYKNAALRSAHVYLDGACGESSMVRIAEAAGLSVTSEHNRKGHGTGFLVTS